MTARELLSRLQTQAPEYWAWLQTKPNALRKIKNLASDGKHWPAFWQAVQATTSFGSFIAGSPEDDEPLPGDETIPPPAEPPRPTPPMPGAIDNGDGTWTLPNGTIVSQQGQIVGTPEILATLQQFLTDNELPASLISFLRQALEQGKPYAQIIAELRQTPEYRTAYPENDARVAAGFDWMPEAQIRAYRSEARRLAEQYLGIGVTNAEVAQLLTKNKSLAEWEKIMQTWQDFERWGPTVRSVFESELGYAISDDRMFAFLAPFIETPELERSYEMALRRGRTAALGLGVRPEEEAEMLRQFGISVEDAFRGYQGIVAEMPRAQRLAAIEAQINAQGNMPSSLRDLELFADTPYATVFRAIQLGDPEAIAALQASLARETARFQAGGGPASGGLGLLSPAERATL